MKIVFLENLRLTTDYSRTDEAYFISEFGPEIDFQSQPAWLVECDTLPEYNKNTQEGKVYITGFGPSLTFYVDYDESHLDMWGYEDFDEIPEGFIFQEYTDNKII